MKKNTSRHKSAAIVSVHDVMPETLPKVTEILRFLETMAVFPVTLLVVPGQPWPAKAINELKSLQAAGYELAGHGWQHQSRGFTSKWHRLHGWLISGTEAEHLYLSTGAIINIVNDCYRWFETVDLEPPTLYVPPAWAMGRISKKTLSSLPFRLYETQTGIYDAHTGIFRIMPVTGYLADTAFRTRALKITNLISRLPVFGHLRIAIHPNDLNLPLANQLKTHLRHCRQFTTYNHLIAPEL